jgi:hypothetical protein
MAMIVGGSMYVTMIAANIAILNLKEYEWAQYLVAIPFYIAVGVGAPLLWTGQAVYLNRVAEAKHAGEGNDPTEEFMLSPSQSKAKLADTKAEYNGTFYALFQANGVVGCAFSSILKLIGSGDMITTILFICLTGFACIGIFILSLLPQVEAVDNLKAKGGNSDPLDSAFEDQHESLEKDTDDDDVSIGETLTFLVSEPRMYCLVPIIFFNGLSLGFINSDYTKYVVAEGIGDKNIGFAIATFYGCNALATKAFGHKSVTGALGRRGLYVLSFVLQVIFFGFFLFAHSQVIGLDGNDMSNFVPPKTKVPINGTLVELSDTKWEAPPGHAAPASWSYVVVFLGAAIFATGDAVLESVVPVTLQNYFAGDDKKVNASAANQKMWQSLGFAAQFAIGAVFPQLDASETVLQHFQLKVIIIGAVLLGGYALAFFTLCKYPIDDDEAHTEKERPSFEGVSRGSFIG